MLSPFFINLEFFKTAFGNKGVMSANVVFLQNELATFNFPFGHPLGKVGLFFRIKGQVFIETGKKFVDRHYIVLRGTNIQNDINKKPFRVVKRIMMFPQNIEYFRANTCDACLQKTGFLFPGMPRAASLNPSR
jgi:hypothetical protein